ncbi:hypothetical protein [Rhodoblastus sp.]|uniref:hypothetical protein n=1 Tax=Rhodoblastus sp. TaxID=1962975 RepID=UPI003F9D0011
MGGPKFFIALHNADFPNRFTPRVILVNMNEVDKTRPGEKPNSQNRDLKEERSGEALIAVMQESPCRDLEIEPAREKMPMRGACFHNDG